MTISATYEPSWQNRPRLGKVKVELVLLDGRYEIQRIEATPPARDALDPEELRLVPFGQLLGFALAGRVKFQDADGRTYSATRPMTDPDPLHGIALTYSMARALRLNPTTEVATRYGLSPRRGCATRVPRPQQGIPARNRKRKGTLMPRTNVPIKKLGERRYQVRYRDQDGKQHKPVFPTHREALADWQEATTQSRQGTYIDPKAGTELLSSFGSNVGSRSGLEGHDAPRLPARFHSCR